MLSITHNEVRRHPRWREEMRTPLRVSQVPRVAGTRLLGTVAFLIVATAIAVLIFKG